jgi:hypothetical protein
VLNVYGTNGELITQRVMDKLRQRAKMGAAYGRLPGGKAGELVGD